MKTTYRVRNEISNSRYTYISEYWDDVRIRTFMVRSQYNGGDIVEFMKNNETIQTWFNYNYQLSLF